MPRGNQNEVTPLMIKDHQKHIDVHRHWSSGRMFHWTGVIASGLRSGFEPRTCPEGRAEATPERKRPLRPGAPRSNFLVGAGPTPTAGGSTHVPSPGQRSRSRRGSALGGTRVASPLSPAEGQGRRQRSLLSGNNDRPRALARARPAPPARAAGGARSAAPGRAPSSPPARPGRPRAASLTRSEMEAAVAAAAPQRAFVLLQDVVVLSLEELHAGPGRWGRRRRPGRASGSAAPRPRDPRGGGSRAASSSAGAARARASGSGGWGSTPAARPAGGERAAAAAAAALGGLSPRLRPLIGPAPAPLHGSSPCPTPSPASPLTSPRLHPLPVSSPLLSPFRSSSCPFPPPSSPAFPGFLRLVPPPRLFLLPLLSPSKPPPPPPALSRPRPWRARFPNPGDCRQNTGLDETGWPPYCPAAFGAEAHFWGLPSHASRLFVTFSSPEKSQADSLNPAWNPPPLPPGLYCSQRPRLGELGNAT